MNKLSKTLSTIVKLPYNACNVSYNIVHPAVSKLIPSLKTHNKASAATYGAIAGASLAELGKYVVYPAAKEFARQHFNVELPIIDTVTKYCMVSSAGILFMYLGNNLTNRASFLSEKTPVFDSGVIGGISAAITTGLVELLR